VNASAGVGSRIIVFARVPRLGKVKTRLARTIGDEAALAVHRELLANVLTTAAQAAPASLELCIAGDDVDGECARLARAFGASLSTQRGAGLGERMQEALGRGLGSGGRAVLIGSDVPSLTVEDLHEAFNALERCQMVFAPAEDGGYGLVGSRPPLPASVFERIPWGSGDVMAATRARLVASQVAWAELRTVWDLDDLAGLARWRAMQDTV
jgi:rSAM/selenodomain-associated transferase 1